MAEEKKLSATGLKKKFVARATPTQTDFADLIELADLGRKAAGYDETDIHAQPKPGPGLTMDSAGRLAVKTDGHTVGFGSILELSVQLDLSGGLQADEHGMRVKLMKDGGLLATMAGLVLNTGPGVTVGDDNLVRLNLDWTTGGLTTTKAGALSVALKGAKDDRLTGNASGLTIDKDSKLGLNVDGMSLKLDKNVLTLANPDVLRKNYEAYAHEQLRAELTVSQGDQLLKAVQQPIKLAKWSEWIDGVFNEALADAADEKYGAVTATAYVKEGWVGKLREKFDQVAGLRTHALSRETVTAGSPGALNRFHYYMKVNTPAAWNEIYAAAKGWEAALLNDVMKPIYEEGGQNRLTKALHDVQPDLTDQITSIVNAHAGDFTKQIDGVFDKALEEAATKGIDAPMIGSMTGWAGKIAQRMLADLISVASNGDPTLKQNTGWKRVIQEWFQYRLNFSEDAALQTSESWVRQINTRVKELVDLAVKGYPGFTGKSTADLTKALTDAKPSKGPSETAMITALCGAFADGETKGTKEGDNTGYERGKSDGDTLGYQRGKSDGDNLGYQRGKSDGDTLGYQRGKSDGDNLGYQRGEKDGNPINKIDILKDHLIYLLKNSKYKDKKVNSQDITTGTFLRYETYHRNDNANIYFRTGTGGVYSKETAWAYGVKGEVEGLDFRKIDSWPDDVYLVIGECTDEGHPKAESNFSTNALILLISRPCISVLGMFFISQSKELLWHYGGSD